MDTVVREKRRKTRLCNPLKEYRRQAEEAAKDLGYGNKVIQRIKYAKTQTEIARIMRTARERSLDND